MDSYDQKGSLIGPSLICSQTRLIGMLLISLPAVIKLKIHLLINNLSIYTTMYHWKQLSIC